MANAGSDYAKMIRSLRVNDLKTLLSYAGRNKNGKKIELQNRALNLLHLHSSAIKMKIKEIYSNRFRQANRHAEQREVLAPDSAMLDLIETNFTRRSSPTRPTGNGMPVIPDLSRNFLEQTAQLSVLPQYPVNPEVRFQDLPFYDVLQELIRPTSLVTLPNDRFQERNLVFYFTPRHVLELQTNLDVQVQLRMCYLDTSCDQDDEMPGSICLKVNNRTCNLPNPIPTNKPGVEPKRPKRPVDITYFIKKTSTEGNEISISWASSSGKPYVVAAYLVRKQNSSVLIRRLKASGVRNPDHTTAMIKEKLCPERDSEIATMSLRGSLMCPLGKTKMELPCRALTCTHLQCFDASLFLQMNEKKPKWICPVCDKPAYFKNLAIDGLFLDITRKAPLECKEVQFHEDGSWTPLMPVKKQMEINNASFEQQPKNALKMQVSKPRQPIEVINLDSDSEDESGASTVPEVNSYRSSKNVPPESIKSFENIRKFDEIINPFNYGAGPSKIETTSKFIPEKSTLSLLPESMEIDSPDVDCIFGAPPILSGPGSSAFESVASYSSSKIDASPSVSLPESENIHRSFRDFDLFSLIKQNEDDAFDNYLQGEEVRSPEVIDID